MIIRRTGLRLLVSVFVFMTFASAIVSKAWPSDNKWTSIGPFNGLVHTLAIDPQNASTV